MGISQVLSDGHLIRANAAYAHMYGYVNPDEMISTDLFQVQSMLVH
jgi:hypothetical protein